ncbi:MAG: hypothetical protein JNK15_21120 [Planctomycetes bacterium]|nr:hypothetical protein [Planctomycetota bacterium]
MHAAAAITATVCLLAATSAQDARKMEVLASSGSPRLMLEEKFRVRADPFVVCDVGLFLDQLVGGTLGDAWQAVELRRHRLWLDCLRCMLAESSETLGERCRGLAAAAVALLTDQPSDAAAVPKAFATDVAAVRAGTDSVLSWHPDAPRADWSTERPTGAYETGVMAQLWRATVYLRAVLSRLPATDQSAWQRSTNAALGIDGQKQLAAIDEAWRLVLGTSRTDPFAVGALAQNALADRARLATATGPWWERLRAAHGAPPSEVASLRGQLLQVAHELATETPQGPMAPVFAHPAWQQKRLDLADFTYVAVREVDGLLCATGDREPIGRPELLVEPLPRTFAALRAAMASAQRICRTAAVEGAFLGLAPERLDPVLALLEHQRTGTEPPAKLVDEVWQLLLGFDGDRRPAPKVRIDGLDGNVRRSGPQLVRMPITWQGQQKTALAFRWFVEHESKPGEWEAPRR